MSRWKCRILFFSIFIFIAFIINQNLNAAEEIKSVPQEKNFKESSFTVFQLSFFAPLQIFPETIDVNGLRITFPYGNNAEVYGLDIGLANEAHNLYGISLAVLLTQRSENMYGINFTGFINLSDGSDIGLSIAGFYNQVDTIEGFQTAFLYNQAQLVKGVQFGLVNYCRDMKGAQIGIFNVCKAQPVPFTLFFNIWK